MEIEPALTRRRIIERLAKGGEVGDSAGQFVESRCRARWGKLDLSLGVALEHAGPSSGCWHDNGFLMVGDYGTKRA
jgi:hypothetical protein